MDQGAGTLSLADRQTENRGGNQSVDVQAQQCITDLSKRGQQEENKQQKDKMDGEI